MKKPILLFVIIIVTFSSTFAQESCNFTIVDDSRLIWQKIYDTQLSESDLFNIIVNSGSAYNVTCLDGKITYNLDRVKIDYKSVGYTWANTPLYVANTDLSCFVTIQVKGMRYRVTVENIILTDNITTGLFIEGDEHPIETWALRQGGVFAKSFLKSAIFIYDLCLSDLFVIREKEYLDGDW